ncbi:Partitioning defective 3 -like protein [Halotydeus destructor]|nr:Partitioning defective 3 -like protein [Halotydeus destructor]
MEATGTTSLSPSLNGDHDYVDSLTISNEPGPLGIHVVPYFDEFEREHGVVIEGIEPGGRIDRDGRLKVCDRIIEVNGQDLLNVEFTVAQEVFRNALRSKEITLKVRKNAGGSLGSTIGDERSSPESNCSVGSFVPQSSVLSSPLSKGISLSRNLNGITTSRNSSGGSSSNSTNISSQPSVSVSPKSARKIDYKGEEEEREREEGLVEGEQRTQITKTATVTPTKVVVAKKPVLLQHHQVPSSGATNAADAGNVASITPTIATPLRGSIRSNGTTPSQALVTGNTRKIGRKYHIRLIKSQDGLGFSITTRDNPAGGNCPIYIKNILSKGAAIKDGRLKQGDRLLEVNGVEMTGKSQNEAATFLKNISVGQQVDLIISRQENQVETAPSTILAAQNSGPYSPKLPRQLPPDKAGDIQTGRQREVLAFEIALNDTGSAGLGLSVKGHTSTVSEGRTTDLGIFIKSVIHGGAASKDGRLKPNDQLLSVNGTSLLGLTNEEATETLRQKMLHCEGPLANPGVIILTIARRVSSTHQQASNATTPSKITSTPSLSHNNGDLALTPVAPQHHRNNSILSAVSAESGEEHLLTPLYSIVHSTPTRMDEMRQSMKSNGDREGTVIYNGSRSPSKKESQPSDSLQLGYGNQRHPVLERLVGTPLAEVEGQIRNCNSSATSGVAASSSLPPSQPPVARCEPVYSSASQQDAVYKVNTSRDDVVIEHDSQRGAGGSVGSGRGGHREEETGQRLVSANDRDMNKKQSLRIKMNESEMSFRSEANDGEESRGESSAFHRDGFWRQSMPEKKLTSLEADNTNLYSGHNYQRGDKELLTRDAFVRNSIERQSRGKQNASGIRYHGEISESNVSLSQFEVIIDGDSWREEGSQRLTVVDDREASNKTKGDPSSLPSAASASSAHIKMADSEMSLLGAENTDDPGFQRDGFGRQSISEKRHAHLDAKNTDTYQRNKKAKEEELLARRALEEELSARAAVEQERLARTMMVSTPTAAIEKGSPERQSARSRSAIAPTRPKEPGCLGGGVVGGPSLSCCQHEFGSCDSPGSLPCPYHSESQVQQQVAQRKPKRREEASSMRGMRKSSSLESLQLMMQDLQRQQLEERGGNPFSGPRPATLKPRSRTTNESFRAAVDRSYEPTQGENQDTMETVAEEDSETGSIHQNQQQQIYGRTDKGPLSKPSAVSVLSSGTQYTGLSATTGTGTMTTSAMSQDDSSLASLVRDHQSKKKGIFNKLFKFGSKKGKKSSKSDEPKKSGMSLAQHSQLEKEAEMIRARRAAQIEQEKIQEHYRALKEQQHHQQQLQQLQDILQQQQLMQQQHQLASEPKEDKYGHYMNYRQIQEELHALYTQPKGGPRQPPVHVSQAQQQPMQQQHAVVKRPPPLPPGSRSGLAGFHQRQLSSPTHDCRVQRPISNYYEYDISSAMQQNAVIYEQRFAPQPPSAQQQQQPQHQAQHQPIYGQRLQTRQVVMHQSPPPQHRMMPPQQSVAPSIEQSIYGELLRRQHSNHRITPAGSSSYHHHHGSQSPVKMVQQAGAYQRSQPSMSSGMTNGHVVRPLQRPMPQVAYHQSPPYYQSQQMVSNGRLPNNGPTANYSYQMHPSIRHLN